jgi:hypothetical protein
LFLFKCPSSLSLSDRIAYLESIDAHELQAGLAVALDAASFALAPEPVSSSSASSSSASSSSSSKGSSVCINESDLNEFMIDIGGILVPKSGSKRHLNSSSSSSSSSASSSSEPLVAVESTARSLRAVALALCEGRPVLVTGPTGCGKSGTANDRNSTQLPF